MTNIKTLAAQLYAAFETAQRDDGAEFVRLKDGSPDWMRDVVFAAHDSGNILPDDRTYRLARDAAAHIADACDGADMGDESHEFADGAVDYANAALARWLADAPGYAAGWIEEYNDQIGDGAACIWKQLQGGQYMEARAVFDAVAGALEDLAEDDE